MQKKILLLLEGTTVLDEYKSITIEQQQWWNHTNDSKQNFKLFRVILVFLDIPSPFTEPVFMQ